MAFSYNLQNREIEFSIGDFPETVQQELFSTLDVNGFISNEEKFRSIVSTNLDKLGLTPKLSKKLSDVVRGGQLLPLSRDSEKLGLNFAYNTYKFSLSALPGRPELLEGTKVAAIIGIAKTNDYYLVAMEDEKGQYHYAGRVKPFLAREKLYAEPVDENEDIIWVDPLKLPKVKIKEAQAVEFISRVPVTASSKFNINWQLARVAARRIPEPSKKIASVLAFLEKEPTVHNYARVLNWLKMTKFGFKDRTVFDEAITNLKNTKEKYSSTEDIETPLEKIPLKDLQAVYRDLKARKYDFQFKATPKAHTEFVERLEKELKAREQPLSPVLPLDEPIEKVKVGEHEYTLRVLTADPFKSKTAIVDISEDTAVIARASVLDGTINNIYSITAEGGLEDDKTNLKEAVASAVSSLTTAYARWAASPKIKKETHCGPCTPLKMKAIELLSDMHYKHNNFDRKFLGQLAAQSEEENNDAFVQTLNKVLDTIKEADATKDVVRKLRQISTTLQDVQYRIDDGEFEMVDKPHAHKEGAFMPSLGRQPFWDQHADGHTSDYSYPLENLDPAHTQKPEGSEEDDVPEYDDAWAAFTKIDAKDIPALLLRLFKTKPLGKKVLEKEAAKDDLAVDPFTIARFYIPELTFKANIPGPSGSNTSCSFKAVLLKTGTEPATYDFAKPGEGVTPAGPPTELEKAKYWRGKKLPPFEEQPLGSSPATDPIYWLNVNKELRSAHPRTISDPARILYQVQYISGPFKNKPVVGTFNAGELLARAISPGKEEITLRNWLIRRIEDKKEMVSTYLSNTDAFNAKEAGAPPAWKLRLNQRIISNDFEEALSIANDNDAALAKEIIPLYLRYLLRSNQQKQAYDIIKKYHVDEQKSEFYDKNIAQYIHWYELMAGKTITERRKEYSPKEFQALADFILLGRDAPYSKQVREEQAKGAKPSDLDPLVVKYGVAGNFFANGDGGSPETKIKILRDLPSGKLEDFIKHPAFLSQPFAVQYEALGRAVVLKEEGEATLLYIFENPAMPFKLRGDALTELVLVHGVGASPRYASQAAAINLLQQAASDADPNIRALAYSLSLNKRVAILPWDADGNLVYKKEDKPSKDQPVVDVPEWFTNGLVMESHSELRPILAELIKNLPKNLVEEVTPPKFAADKKTLVTRGAYKFTEEIVDSIEKVVLAALHNSDTRVRNMTRTHFGLPEETAIVPEKKEEPKLVETITPYAAHWLGHALRELKQALASYFDKGVDTFDDALKVAESHLRSARSSFDWKEHGQDIDATQKYLNKFKQLGDLLIRSQKDYASPEEFRKLILDRTPEIKFKPFDELSIDDQLDAVRFINLNRAKAVEEAPEPLKEKQLELPISEEDEEFKKEGRLVISRQPPTTWPLKEPQTGYGSAFPLAPKDDGLLAKDVQQFIGRPQGKWRSYLAELWKILFKELEEEKVEKEASAEITTDAQAMDALIGNTAQARAALDYFFSKKDEEGLLGTLSFLVRPERTSLLLDVIAFAEDNDFKNIINKVLSTPGFKNQARGRALDVLAAWKDAPTLEKYIGTELYPEAVNRLAKIAPDRLKEIYQTVRPAIQTRIVFELGGLSDDTSFLTEALKNPDATVRRQAAEWLGHYGHFDLLKKHQDTEPSIKEYIDDTLTRYDAGMVSDIMQKLEPEDQSKEIAKLVDTATKAFTKWEQYPAIRQRVLGVKETAQGSESFHGKRYPHSDKLLDWNRYQKAIDEEIAEEFDKIPSLDAGKKALDGLKKIVDNPGVLAKIKRMEQWLAMTRERLGESPKDSPLLSKYKEVEEDHRRQLKEIVEPLKFKVEELELLYREMVAREKKMEVLRDSQEFTKRYPAKGSWVDYKAYQEAADPAADKKRSDHVWEYTQPLQARYFELQKEIKELGRALSAAYKKLHIGGKTIETDEFGPSSAEIRQLTTDLIRKEQLNDAWLREAGFVEPYAVVNDIYYRMLPASWHPAMKERPVSGYSRGKVLVPARVAEVKSPYYEEIKAMRQELDSKRRELLKSLKEKLPAGVQALLDQYKTSLRESEKILSKLEEYGIGISGDKFIPPHTLFLQEEKRKKQFDNERRALSKKREEITDKTSPEYIKLKVAEKEFKKEYGVFPFKDSPKLELYKQWALDRWRAPFLSSTPTTPAVIGPYKEQIREIPPQEGTPEAWRMLPQEEDTDIVEKDYS